MWGSLGLSGILCLGTTLLAVSGIHRGALIDWLEAVTCVIAGLAGCLVLFRRLPAQNAIGGGLVLLGLVALALTLSVRTGMPLGEVEYGDRMGLWLLGLVPAPLPFLWVALLLTSRETARVMLRPWRRERYYGYGLLGAASLLVALSAVSLEPFAVTVQDWWSWPDHGSALWYGVPWTTFPVWLVVAAFMLLLATPWLVPKRPIPTPVTLYSPALWTLLNIWFLAGNLSHGVWAPGLIGLAAVGTVVVLSWWGWRADSAGTVQQQESDAPGETAREDPG